MLSYKIYLNDILEMIFRIEKDIKKLEDLKEEKNYDATLMRFQVIGESIKKLPEEIKEKYKDVKWKKIASLRNLISHEYFKVMPEIIFQIIENDLPELKKAVKGENEK